MDRYWFKSEFFKIESGEDVATNPGCYGKHLANWLCHHFETIGYTPEVIPEDWGWCVMCKTRPFSLWIGCGTTLDLERDVLEPPVTHDVTWHCFVVAEIPFFRKLFGKIDTAAGVEKLKRELGCLLNSTRHIKLVEEP